MPTSMFGKSCRSQIINLSADGIALDLGGEPGGFERLEPVAKAVKLLRT